MKSILSRLNLSKSGILFDRQYYLAKYPDIAAAGVDPYRHFLDHGISENRQPNAFFDPQYYLGQISDKPRDPTKHYLAKGAKAGLDPHPLFDTRWYLEAYPDVAAAQMNPLVHYLRNGRREGRRTSPEYREAFGSRLPAAYGCSFPKFSSMEFSSDWPALPAAQMLPELVIPLHIPNEHHEAIAKALEMAGRKGNRIIKVNSAIPTASAPVTLCIAFSHCYTRFTGRKLSISYQEVKLFRIIEGTVSYIASAGRSCVSLFP